jgi:catechol 2,3-dioxygenase
MPTATIPRQLLPVGTHLGAIHLAVTDSARALDFWTRVVGLTILGRDADGIRLGAGARAIVVLHPGAVSPVVRHRTGLYHLAIHLPSRKELARALARLIARRWPNSPTDHLVTETTYLSDPDGIGIELTFETPARGELIVLPDGRPAARTAAGALQSMTEPLDVDSLLGELDPRESVDAPLADGARLGHVHLHVADLDAALAFYRDLIGFRPSLYMPTLRMTDAAVDRAVPHTLALNEWSGAGAPPPPPGAAGLRHFGIVVPAAGAVGEIAARLETHDWRFERIPDGIRVFDPSANAVHVVAEPNGS